jgi:ABC-type Mn2+/Zn2+ transport system ATPase subunit
MPSKNSFLFLESTIMTSLSWKNLVVGYQKPLAHPFSGKITQPGIYAILGQNGCGKSTLLKTWLGLVTPFKGTVSINHVSLPTTTLQGKLAYVPQCHAVNSYFHISILRFVEQGFGPKNILTIEKKERIVSLLEEWQLKNHQKKSFHELSAGQKTRAMIVRAIVSQPQMLFLDEPLASLDPCCQQQLMDALKTFTQESKVCVFIVDHHLEHFKDDITKKICFTRNHDQEMCEIIF